MSFFVGSTPFVRLVLRNKFSASVFPTGGPAAVVVDTGYDGFLAVPGSVFKALGLGDGPSNSREGTAADGRRIAIRSALATAELYLTSTRFDGFVDTWEGMDEFLVGTEFLRGFKATLDYCSNVFRLAPCP